MKRPIARMMRNVISEGLIVVTSPSAARLFCASTGVSIARDERLQVLHLHQSLGLPKLPKLLSREAVGLAVDAHECHKLVDISDASAREDRKDTPATFDVREIAREHPLGSAGSGCTRPCDLMDVDAHSPMITSRTVTAIGKRQRTARGR